MPVLSLAFVQVPCVAIDLPGDKETRAAGSNLHIIKPTDLFPHRIQAYLISLKASEEVADRLLRNIPPSYPNYLVNRNKIINALATVSQYKRQKLEEFLTSKENFKNGLGISRFPFDRRTFLIEVMVTCEESEWKEVTQSQENMLRMEQKVGTPVVGPQYSPPSKYGRNITVHH